MSAQTHPELHGDRKRATKALEDAVKVAKARERGTVIESDPNAVHRVVSKGLGGGSNSCNTSGIRADYHTTIKPILGQRTYILCGWTAAKYQADHSSYW